MGVGRMLDFSVLGAEFTDDPQAQLPTEMLHTCSDYG